MMMESSGCIWIIGRSFAMDFQHDLTPAETPDERYKSAGEQRLLPRPVPFLYDSKQLLVIGLAHGYHQASALGELLYKRLWNSGRGGRNQNGAIRGVARKSQRT